MARQGLMDDSGYMGFEECSRWEECNKEAYEKGRADKYQEIVSDYMLLTEKQVAEIRADAINEHFRKIMGFINTNNRGNCDYFIVDQIENYIAEQLKEQNKCS